MKKSKNMVIMPSVESRELCLYVENRQEFNSPINFIAKNFARKMKKGIYDRQKAIDALYPITTEGAKMYEREFGTPGAACPIFNVTARYSAAAELLDIVKDLAKDILNEMK